MITCDHHQKRTRRQIVLGQRNSIKSNSRTISLLLIFTWFIHITFTSVFMYVFFVWQWQLQKKMYKCIMSDWIKEDPPFHSLWANEVNLRRTPQIFQQTWPAWIDFLEQYIGRSNKLVYSFCLYFCFYLGLLFLSLPSYYYYTFCLLSILYF